MSRLSSTPLPPASPAAPLLRTAALAALLLGAGCVDDPTSTLGRPGGPRLAGARAIETDLGDLGGGGVFVHDMNDAGQIVGNTWKDANGAGGDVGFLWEPGGTMQWIAGDQWCEQTRWGLECYIIPGDALAINAGGMVTGSDGYTTARWPPATQIPGDARGPGRDINDAGDAVGGSPAFLWTFDDLVTLLGTLPGQSGSHGVRINNARQITGGSGPRGFFWQNGTMQDLGTLGGSSTQPTDLNEAGQVVGRSSVAGDAAVHAFLWTPGGGMQDLGTLGGANSHASAINARGQVVGWAETAGGTRHAFLWTAAEGMVDVGTLPLVHDPTRPAPDPALSGSEALDINDAGIVTGFSRAGYRVPYAFVWSRASGMQILGNGYGKVINNRGQVAGGSAHPTENVGEFNRGRFWDDIAIRVGPTADAGGPYQGEQSEPILFDGTATLNPDGEALVFAWDFTGDGVADSTGAQTGFAFDAPGSYPVRLFVTDAAGVTWTDDAVVTIGPPRWPHAVIAPPPGGQYAVAEGGRILLSSQGSAAENGGLLLYRWEFGDGTAAQSRHQDTAFAWSKVYGDNGTYTVRLIVWDAASRADTATVSVTVRSTAPTAALRLLTPYEGQDFTLEMLNATDSSAIDRRAGFAYAFDCGTGGYTAFGGSTWRTCSGRPDNVSHAVGARIRDKDGSVREYRRTVTPLNARPVITGATWLNTLLTFGFTDAGTEDGPWRWVVRWGDGTRSEGWAGVQGNNAVLAPHAYAAPGTYTVLVHVYDKDGASSGVHALTVTR
ncbi:MAG TPA: PKD domain-containing protein [Longimicrobium sp.]|uniref:PKD domain-containing protein n=1 Tax=Longimicrobium sp. TaxID=2029185 RepID=UPI002ED9E698